MQDNMIIKGDNLEVLKSLLPYYTGKVKCIYIDPPYNTGNAFEHYNDNLEHSTWLNMMYPRLQLMRELLREDGVIFVQIDDEEQAYLKVIMDEVFGRENFETNFYIQVRYAGKTLAEKNNYQKLIETILCYKKSSLYKPIKKQEDYSLDKFVWDIQTNTPDKTIELKGRKVEVFFENNYSIIQKDSNISLLKETWASGTVLKNNASGKFFNDYLSKRVAEDGLKVLYKVYGIGEDGLGYRFFTGPKKENATKGKFYSGVPLDRIDELKNGQSIKEKSIENFADYSDSFGNCRLEGNADFRGGKKPEILIETILEMSTQPDDLILDCFLGSGTTVAVAHKMNRRYIGVEIGDHIMTHVVPRMKKVIDGTDQGGISKSVNWTGGGSYRYYELGDTIFDSNGKISKSVDFDTLASHIWFSETGTPLKEIISPLVEGRCPQDRGELLECKIKNEELRFDKIDNLSTPPINSVDILPAMQGGIRDDMGHLPAKQRGIESCPSLMGNVNEVDKGELNNNLESKSTPPPLRGTSPQSREGLGMVSNRSFQGREGLNIQNKTALLGIYNNVAYVLLYNGILKDKRPKDGNVLNYAVLSYIEELLSDKVYKNIVVYGDACKIKNNVLEEKNVVFKQIPYSVKGK